MTLGFLVYLGLIALQGIGSRHILSMSFTTPQIIIVACSAFAVALCIFSVASRNLTKLNHSIVEHCVEFGTLGTHITPALLMHMKRSDEP